MTVGCKKCGSKHNTLLHIEHQTSGSQNQPVNQVSLIGESEIQISSSKKSESESQSINLSNQNISDVNDIFLSTALVQITDSFNNMHTCRALLDSASQSNMITQELCEKLNLETTDFNTSVLGIGQIPSQIKHRTAFTIHSCHNNFKSNISCLVIPQISPNLPRQRIISSIKIPQNIRLADPSFNIPAKIDLLLGAQIFYRLLCVGQINLGENQPILQRTVFGWVISGPVRTVGFNNPSCFLNFNNVNLEIQNQLRKFWELEECTVARTMFTTEEQECETIFQSTTSRAENGQFIVQYPLKKSPIYLGESKQKATKQFFSLENKLDRTPKLCRMYKDFMNEYIELEHMSKVDISPSHDEISYFLPHHGILNEMKTTTKLRVVFNGSSPTTSGWSFNDLQMVGPTIQDDLLSIILRFRKHNVVICSDVEKMYRMILIHPRQRSLQQIIWRSNHNDKIESYKLNTVTYGTAAAPFLAVRCLKQLAMDYSVSYPAASNVIMKDFYMDDLLTGADTINQVVQLATEIYSILSSASFTLRKWASNKAEALRKLEMRENSFHVLKLGEKETTKTLGLYCHSQDDIFKYNIDVLLDSKPVTKRSILSEISQIFDPLGLVSPCIISAKILLQELWLHKIAWDESIPLSMDTKWRFLKRKLKSLNNLEIPRHVIHENARRVELHGFCDGSSVAYGGCIYIRSITSSEQIYVSLLCAKSKVAPIKHLTVPRLELCAALILSKLYLKVIKAMNYKFDEVYFWSDLAVVLYWIRKEPCYLQQFVSNRVTQIQSLTESNCWRHVTSEDNPADVLSRGIQPDLLYDFSLWWVGPSWLSEKYDRWPNSCPQIQNDIPELKKYCNICVENSVEPFPFHKFSKFNKLKRVTAYILRFIYNCRFSDNRKVGFLTVDECDFAILSLVRIVQQEHFSDVINHLKNNKISQLKGTIVGLSALMDHQGILRVGGRLQMSQFPYEKRHPILLSAKHQFTKLLFSHEHLRCFHAAPQLLLSVIRESYWPLGARCLARKTIRSCVKCFRYNPSQPSPIMGVLPKDRVNIAPPFNFSGVDYAGPFYIKEKLGRGSKSVKCWVSLFICFVTKAIHLEPVTQMSSEAFLAMFRRFVSRRGKPETIYSDNGTTMVGANSELVELGSFLLESNKNISEKVANEGVNWLFIPAYSPNFGGLWEARVKSSKYHLKRVLSKALLTYEEFYTVLTQIEAILNSRPLTPLSPDPSDLEPLTPSHFLIGRKLTSLPDPTLTHIPENRLSRFQRIQQIQQHFWTRWEREYVSELQQKQKWKITQSKLKVGDMVLIKHDNCQSLQWPLGRIIDIHPGPDGVARIASIKTSSGVVKRSYSKICILLIEAE